MKLIFKPSKKKIQVIKPVKLKFFNESIYPKRSKAEWKLIDRNPFGDTDKDRVPNWFDCKPLNRKKQGYYSLPMSKKKYYRELRAQYPMVVSHSKGKAIDVLSRGGIKTFTKTREEKLEDIKKKYPELADATVESQIELEKGSAYGVLAKGRTPGMIIFKQKTEKERSPYDTDYSKKMPKIQRLAIVDTKTGDIQTFDESGKYTKKQIEKERKDTEIEKYYPGSELNILEEADASTKLLNKSSMRTIREKRNELRREARMKQVDPADITDKYPEEETLEAFKQITKEGLMEDLKD